MNGNWARYETVRGKGSTVNCMFCGRKPQILEKGFCDGSHVFSICCPHCWNKHFRDNRETGVDITVCSETIYPGIRDWNKVNGAFNEARKQFERPHGEWIKGKEISRMMIANETLHIDYKDFTCSNCGLVLDRLLYHVDGSAFYKFCPNCGAKMVKGDDDLDD